MRVAARAACSLSSAQVATDAPQQLPRLPRRALGIAQVASLLPLSSSATNRLSDSDGSSRSRERHTANPLSS